MGGQTRGEGGGYESLSSLEQPDPINTATKRGKSTRLRARTHIIRTRTRHAYESARGAHQTRTHGAAVRQGPFRG